MLEISRAAFNFVDGIERESDRSVVMGRFGRELARYGFHAWLMTGLPNPGNRIDPQPPWQRGSACRIWPRRL